MRNLEDDDAVDTAAAVAVVVVRCGGGWIPLSQRTRAMRDERLGSYSMRSTIPTEEEVLRLRSITRCKRLWPPPRWKEVMRP